MPFPSSQTGVSAAALLDLLPLDPGAREAIRARFEVSTAATADRVEAAALAGVAAHSDDICPSVAGGNQRIALALASGLGAGVHLSSPVERVTWGDGPALVRAGGAEVAADRVVLALPASVVGRVVFDPPLPEPLRSAYAAVEYGNAAKLFVPLTREAPPSAVLSVPERYWCWTATGADGVQPVVNAFAGSAPALARLGVADGPETWLDSLAAASPRPGSRTRRCRPLDLGRRPVGAGRVLLHGSRALRMGPRRSVPRVRRAHPRLEPGADGRGARERSPCGAGDARREVGSRPHS